jgi:putative photosynthetic complex assembly protein
MSDATSDHNREENVTVPKPMIIAAAALILFSIVISGLARWTGFGAAYSAREQAVRVHDLRFEDRSDGGIAVREAADGRLVASLPPGADGFVRTVLRSLAFERNRHNVGAEPSFRMVEWSDGRFTLDDPATGRSVDLAAFGGGNKQAFVNILKQRSERP